MGENFEAKFVGDKISSIKILDDAVGAETFIAGTYDSEVHSTKHAVC